MSPPSASEPARADLSVRDGVADVVLTGDWRITLPRPTWTATLAGSAPARVRPQVDAVENWDSALLLFLFEIQQWCTATGAVCDLAALPEKMRRLLAQLGSSHETSVPVDRSEGVLVSVGNATLGAGRRGRNVAQFVGECVIAAVRLLKNPRKFRVRDCLEEMQQCGAMALPIVSLISLLVGLIMAYQAAVQLRQFGADIFVADLVGLAVIREMGPMMAAVVLAGRTGAAFAATLANMKANEEVDALETLGIPTVDFLVMPRLIALAVMMPLLALYANCLGVVGGMIVGAGVLEIPPAAYWVETQSIVSLSDVTAGLAKSFIFGLLIALAGCLRGLQADRSAVGVGRAATSAVVTSILLIIVADAIFAVMFNVLGW